MYSECVLLNYLPFLFIINFFIVFIKMAEEV